MSKDIQNNMSYSPSNTRGFERHINPISLNHQRSEAEQGRFLKREYELGVASFRERFYIKIMNCKFRVKT